VSRARMKSERECRWVGEGGRRRREWGVRNTNLDLPEAREVVELFRVADEVGGDVEFSQVRVAVQGTR